MAGKLSRMFTGVKRYFANSYTDIEKNNCVKLVLGKHPSQKRYGVQAALEARMAEPEIQSAFTSFMELRVGIITWNLGGNPPPALDSF